MQFTPSRENPSMSELSAAPPPVLTGMQDKILRLLGSGLAPAVVATTVGCNPSYISQLLENESFALEVAKIRCEDIEQDLARDDKYDRLEDKLVDKLENVLAFMVKPRDILLAIQVINNAKRRSSGNSLAPNEGRAIHVHLSLPVTVVKQFQLNKENEVIEVEGRTLTNMPAANLMKSLEDKRAQNEQRSAPALKLSSKQIERAIITPDQV
jgi:DNA-binding CsgD family transcriptional regulator